MKKIPPLFKNFVTCTYCGGVFRNAYYQCPRCNAIHVLRFDFPKRYAQKHLIPLRKLRKFQRKLLKGGEK